jgi:DNA repair protein RecO (recombination protein O)
MPAERTEAIVLRTYSLTESSKIAVLLAPLRGKVRAVAKGVRRTKSKFGSALEPMTHVEVQMHYKDGRDLQTLSQAVTREAFPAVRAELSRLGVAAVMCELMEQFVQEDEESSRPFVLLLLSLKTLGGIQRNLASLLISFYLRALEVFGLVPDMSSCMLCKKALSQHAYLDASAGGLLCSACGSGRPGKLSAGSVKVMQRLLSAEWTMIERIRITDSAADEILKALNAYVFHHTGRELRSIKFLRSVANLR